MLHRGRDRADEAVGDQNAEEGADQRRADLVADGRRVGAVERGHRVHDAEHRGDDAEAGQRVGHLLHGVRGLVRFLVMRLELVSRAGSRARADRGCRRRSVAGSRVMNSIM